MTLTLKRLRSPHTRDIPSNEAYAVMSDGKPIGYIFHTFERARPRCNWQVNRSPKDWRDSGWASSFENAKKMFKDRWDYIGRYPRG